MGTLRATAHKDQIEMIMIRFRYSFFMLGVSIHLCKQFATNRTFLSLPRYILAQSVIKYNYVSTAVRCKKKILAYLSIQRFLSTQNRLGNHGISYLYIYTQHVTYSTFNISSSMRRPLKYISMFTLI